jgi:hypothetical protein
VRLGCNVEIFSGVCFLIATIPEWRLALLPEAQGMINFVVPRFLDA